MSSRFALPCDLGATSNTGVADDRSAGRYARLVRVTLLHINAPAAIHGAISEAKRNGGPEFQGVARNQPTRGNVPRATAEACRFDRDAEKKNAAAPISTNDPSPIETPRSEPCFAASRKHPAAKSA